MNRYKSLALLLCAAAVAACDKNGRQAITAPASGANIRFVNLTVTSPGVNFFAGTTKLTAISSTSCQPPNDTTTTCRTNGVESTTGTGFNSAASGGNYAEVPAGSYTLTGQIAATTDHGLAVASVTTNLDDSKYYSFFMSGVYDATGKKADAFVVEDQLPVVDFTQSYVRVVNAISASQPLTVTAKNQATGAVVTIGNAIAYKSGGAFVALPAGVYDVTGTAAGLTAFTTTTVSFSFGHAYTIAARGDPASSVAANKPAFSNLANR